jgi:hypothetical protein
VSYGEALALITELQQEWGSHLSAEMHGWTIPASYGDVMQATTAQTVITMLTRLIGADPSDPLPMPWTPAAEPPLPPEEVDALRAELASRSAFRD